MAIGEVALVFGQGRRLPGPGAAVSFQARGAFDSPRLKSSFRAAGVVTRVSTTWIAFAVVAYASAHGIIYQLDQLPPDVEARVACCAIGPAPDGLCLRPGEMVQAIPGVVGATAP
jgi:hypothetical protein